MTRNFSNLTSTLSKRTHGLSLSLGLTVGLATVAHAQSLMIVGSDEKLTWDNQGATLFLPDEGRDTVSIYDIGSDPKTPKLIKSLALTNSIAGPPTNVAITPDGQLGLVANSLKWEQKEGKWKPSPDNKLHLIDLSTEPNLLESITVDQQPSGMTLNPTGDLLLIANRKDSKISVVKITGKTAKLITSVEIGEKTAAISFTPDGSRAFFVMKAKNKVGVLYINEDEVVYNPSNDINVGVAPYNIVVSPKGGIALVNNIGATGGNDGDIDTVSVIDIDGDHPHVIDSIAVGDGPEGLAISPDGTLAISVLINGSQNAQAKPENKWAHHNNGKIAVLKIDGKKVSKTAEFDVGALPEGVAFSENGQYFYVGNFLSKDMSIFEVNGTEVKDTGERLSINGSPASVRSN